MVWFNKPLSITKFKVNFKLIKLISFHSHRFFSELQESRRRSLFLYASLSCLALHNDSLLLSCWSWQAHILMVLCYFKITDELPGKNCNQDYTKHLFSLTMLPFSTLKAFHPSILWKANTSSPKNEYCFREIHPEQLSYLGVFCHQIHWEFSKIPPFFVVSLLLAVTHYLPKSQPFFHTQPQKAHFFFIFI